MIVNFNYLIYYYHEDNDPLVDLDQLKLIDRRD